MSLYGRRRGGRRRYGYALGRVLVLTGRLLEPGRLDRLAHARTLPDQLKVLSETEFAPHVADVRDRAGVRHAVERRVVAALDLLDESFAGPVARFFRLPRDFTNIKVALARGRYDVEQPYVEGGTVSCSRWEDDDLDDWLAQELAAAEAAAAAGGEGAGMAYVDERLLAMRLDAARSLADPVAIELARLDIDWANARMLSRGGSASALFAGGLLDATDLAHVFKAGGPEGLVLRLAHELKEAGIEETLRPGAPRDRLEVAAVRSILTVARRGRLNGVGTQPIFAWMASVEAEARMVSLIVLGGLDGAPADEVVDRVRASHG